MLRNCLARLGIEALDIATDLIPLTQIVERILALFQFIFGTFRQNDPLRYLHAGHWEPSRARTAHNNQAILKDIREVDLGTNRKSGDLSHRFVE
jgi:hypothetical protein